MVAKIFAIFSPLTMDGVMRVMPLGKTYILVNKYRGFDNEVRRLGNETSVPRASKFGQPRYRQLKSVRNRISP